VRGLFEVSEMPPMSPREYRQVSRPQESEGEAMTPSEQRISANMTRLMLLSWRQIKDAGKSKKGKR